MGCLEQGFLLLFNCVTSGAGLFGHFWEGLVREDAFDDSELMGISFLFWVKDPEVVQFIHTNFSGGVD